MDSNRSRSRTKIQGPPSNSSSRARSRNKSRRDRSATTTAPPVKKPVLDAQDEEALQRDFAQRVADINRRLKENPEKELVSDFEKRVSSINQRLYSNYYPEVHGKGGKGSVRGSRRRQTEVERDEAHHGTEPPSSSSYADAYVSQVASPRRTDRSRSRSRNRENRESKRKGKESRRERRAKTHEPIDAEGSRELLLNGGDAELPMHSSSNSNLMLNEEHTGDSAVGDDSLEEFYRQVSKDLHEYSLSPQDSLRYKKRQERLALRSQTFDTNNTTNNSHTGSTMKETYENGAGDHPAARKEYQESRKDARGPRREEDASKREERARLRREERALRKREQAEAEAASNSREERSPKRTGQDLTPEPSPDSHVRTLQKRAEVRAATPAPTKQTASHIHGHHTFHDQEEQALEMKSLQEDIKSARRKISHDFENEHRPLEQTNDSIKYEIERIAAEQRAIQLAQQQASTDAENDRSVLSGTGGTGNASRVSGLGRSLPALSWENLNVPSVLSSTRKKHSRIARRIAQHDTDSSKLHRSTGYLHSGELMVVLSPVVSEADDFLRLISFHCKGVGKLLDPIYHSDEASVRVDMASVSDDFPAPLICYLNVNEVYQGKLGANLTIREWLDYQASVSSAQHRISREDMKARVEWVVDHFKLRSASRRRISPHDMLPPYLHTRLLLAQSFLSAPSILVVSHFHLGHSSPQLLITMNMCREACDHFSTGMIVAVPPSHADVVEHANSVLLLARGKEVYFGDPTMMTDLYSMLMPDTPNRMILQELLSGLVAESADGLLDLEGSGILGGPVPKSSLPYITTAAAHRYSGSDQWRQVRNYVTSTAGRMRHVPKRMTTTRPKTSWSEVATTSMYSLIMSVRNKTVLFREAFISLFTALLFGCIMFQLDPSVDRVSERETAVFAILVSVAVMQQSLLGFEYRRRRQFMSQLVAVERAYHTFILGDIPSILLIRAPIVALSFLPAYFMIGFSSGSITLLLEFLAVLYVFLVAVVALRFSAMELADRARNGETLYWVFLLGIFLFSDKLVNVDVCPSWLLWVYYTSPATYAYRLILSNELESIGTLTCHATQVDNSFSLSSLSSLLSFDAIKSLSVFDPTADVSGSDSSVLYTSRFDIFPQTCPSGAQMSIARGLHHSTTDIGYTALAASVLLVVSLIIALSRSFHTHVIGQEIFRKTRSRWRYIVGAVFGTLFIAMSIGSHFLSQAKISTSYPLAWESGSASVILPARVSAKIIAEGDEATSMLGATRLAVESSLRSSSMKLTELTPLSPSILSQATPRMDIVSSSRPFSSLTEIASVKPRSSFETEDVLEALFDNTLEGDILTSWVHVASLGGVSLRQLLPPALQFSMWTNNPDVEAYLASSLVAVPQSSFANALSSGRLFMLDLSWLSGQMELETGFAEGPIRALFYQDGDAESSLHLLAVNFESSTNVVAAYSFLSLRTTMGDNSWAYVRALLRSSIRTSTLLSRHLYGQRTPAAAAVAALSAFDSSTHVVREVLSSIHHSTPMTSLLSESMLRSSPVLRFSSSSNIDVALSSLSSSLPFDVVMNTTRLSVQLNIVDMSTLSDEAALVASVSDVAVTYVEALIDAHYISSEEIDADDELSTFLSLLSSNGLPYVARSTGESSRAHVVRVLSSLVVCFSRHSLFIDGVFGSRPVLLSPALLGAPVKIVEYTSGLSTSLLVSAFGDSQNILSTVETLSMLSSPPSSPFSLRPSPHSASGDSTAFQAWRDDLQALMDTSSLQYWGLWSNFASSTRL